MDIETQDMVLGSIIEGAKFLIQELGAFAIGATVVGWVAKDAIAQYFDKKLSIYQAEIDKEVNRYQAELEKDKFRFSKLHNERARVTAELYEKFVEFEEDMIRLTDPRIHLTEPMEYTESPTQEEKLEAAQRSGNDFMKFYAKKKIYFPQSVCETVEELQEELKGVFDGFQTPVPKTDSGVQTPDIERWVEHWETVTKEEVPELKSELEEHFRDLLGVSLREETS